MVDLGAAHVGTLQGQPHERLLEGSRAVRVLQVGEVPVGALDADHGDGVPEQAPRLLLASRTGADMSMPQPNHTRVRTGLPIPAWQSCLAAMPVGFLNLFKPTHMHQAVQGNDDHMWRG